MCETHKSPQISTERNKRNEESTNIPKKIIFHVTRQYMKRNPGRTAVTFTGIALMVMLMTCVFVGKDTVLRYLDTDLFRQQFGFGHQRHYRLYRSLFCIADYRRVADSDLQCVSDVLP